MSWLVEFYHLYGRRMLGFAFRKLNSTADAEDATHAVIARVMRALLRGVDVTPAYVRVALRRECSAVLRRRTRLQTLETDEPDGHPAILRRSRALAAIADRKDECAEELVQLVAALPETCARVVRLRLDGYTRAEIAWELDVSPKTVDAHWQKARAIGRAERERERE